MFAILLSLAACDGSPADSGDDVAPESVRYYVIEYACDETPSYAPPAGALPMSLQAFGLTDAGEWKPDAHAVESAAATGLAECDGGYVEGRLVLAYL